MADPSEDAARPGSDAAASRKGGNREPPRPSRDPRAIEEEALEGRQVGGDLDEETALRLLREGELTIVGRLLAASNATFYCLVRERCDDPDEGLIASCVYKPIRGERPLADFPDGTLAFREVAAFAVSRASGWDIAPPTVLGDGPLGRGMVQLWVETDESVDVVELVTHANPRLRDIALFDAVTNNADRKGGHLLPRRDGRIQGIDHGLCFAVEPKLRTILWGWRGERLDDGEIGVLERLRAALDGPLGEELRSLLSPSEVRATSRRLDALLAHRRFPLPDRNRPVIPWPPF